MDIGFDVIGDLYLSPEESFNWEGKATSLYCLVVGNVSSDLRTILQTLTHLCRFYKGVFYIMGPLEYETAQDIGERTDQLLEHCSRTPNLAVLYHHVVVIDGIAVLGCNGWDLANYDPSFLTHRHEDLAYVKKSIEKLQRHLDVKKIILVSHAVPNRDLYYGEAPIAQESLIPLDYCLSFDTEMKVSHWVFGKYEKSVDTTIGSVNFVNNPYYKKKPYWAKRIAVNF